MMSFFIERFIIDSGLYIALTSISAQKRSPSRAILRVLAHSCENAVTYALPSPCALDLASLTTEGRENTESHKEVESRLSRV